MPEFVPTPTELRRHHEEEEPQPESTAERIGDRILRWFEPGDREEARGFFSGAVAEAFRTVFGRVLLTFSLPVTCCLFIYGFMRGAWLLDIRSPFSYSDGWVINTLLTVVAVVSGATSLVMPLVEVERKIFKLNWVAFTFIACGSLAVTYEKFPVFLLLIGQFGIHWIIHSGIRLRERQAEWERRRSREEARSGRSLTLLQVPGHLDAKKVEDPGQE